MKLNDFCSSPAGQGIRFWLPAAALAFTVALAPKDVQFLDRCRRKRHTAVYEQVGAVSDHEAKEMIQTAQRLRQHIENWLKKEHPQLRH